MRIFGGEGLGPLQKIQKYKKSLPSPLPHPTRLRTWEGGASSSDFPVLQEALAGLIRQYPGEYNFLLSNGRFLWAFTNHRQFLLLKGSRQLEDALLLTTIEEGLSPEDWRTISLREGTWGKILLVAGGDLVLEEDLWPLPAYPAISGQDLPSRQSLSN